MSNLLTFNARICPTAGGFLIHQNKILLVKHKKLGIWLAPGGHIEDGELPHQAAEREFFEETNIKVKATSTVPLLSSHYSQFLPTPLIVNIHWISKDNYRIRLDSSHPNQAHSTKLWPKGCEQHLVYNYLVQPLSSVIPNYDPNESDGIDWFTPEQMHTLETSDDIKQEIKLAFQVLNKSSTNIA